MENASRAFLDAVRKSMRQIRAAIGAATINPKLLTSAERLQYEGMIKSNSGDLLYRRQFKRSPFIALNKFTAAPSIRTGISS